MGDYLHTFYDTLIKIIRPDPHHIMNSKIINSIFLSYDPENVEYRYNMLKDLPTGLQEDEDLAMIMMALSGYSSKVYNIYQNLS